jgi:hypothetical protein
LVNSQAIDHCVSEGSRPAGPAPLTEADPPEKVSLGRMFGEPMPVLTADPLPDA